MRTLLIPTTSCQAMPYQGRPLLALVSGFVCPPIPEGNDRATPAIQAAEVT